MQIDPSVPGFAAMNIALVVLQALHVSEALDLLSSLEWSAPR
jgi:hypothetical protein